MKVLFFSRNFNIQKLTIQTIEQLVGRKINSKITYKIDILDKMIWQYEPDILFTHCHTENSDFYKIKKLTKEIQLNMPKCVIIITFHPDIDDGYEMNFLQGYSYDLMIPEFPIYKEYIRKIYNIFLEKNF